MFDAIIDFFSGIIDFLSILIEFVFEIFNDIAYLVKLLGDFLVQIPSYLSWLPASVSTLFVLLFGIAVVYKVLGREG